MITICRALGCQNEPIPGESSHLCDYHLSLKEEGQNVRLKPGPAKFSDAMLAYRRRMAQEVKR